MEDWTSLFDVVYLSFKPKLVLLLLTSVKENSSRQWMMTNTVPIRALGTSGRR